MKIYKYMVEDELCHLKEIDKSYFTDYINKLSVKQNALVREEKEGIYWYYCTNCKKWHRDIKFNVKTHKKCPYCKNEYKVITKRNIIKKYEDYITVLEKNERNELIIRLFYFYKHYDKHEMKFNIDCFEVERINFDRDVYMKMNTFSNMGYIFHRRNNTIKADKCYRGYYGHHDKYASIYPFDNLITKNVKRLITKTNYKYSCLEKIVKHHIDILDYLLLYRQFNNIELLVKNKNFNLVREIVKQNIIPEELKVKSNLKYLKYDLTLDEFVNAVYFKEENYEDIKLYANADAKQEVQAVYKYNKNIKKICRYLNDQKEKMSYYKDYIIFADMLGYDLKDKNVLYPSNLIKAHDEAENKVAIFKDKLITKKIAERSKELEKYIFKMNKLIIIPAHSQEELIEESKQLQHCVRRYAERVAKGETNIFFIRKENDENKSYVTLELRNNKVVQCRGYKNNITKPLDEKVKVFVNGWCRKNNFESCFR